MKWNDTGILVGITKFGETDQLATFVTFEHGLSKGLIKGGISKKQKPYLQIGNEFNIVWKSRLEEQLGFFSFEATKVYGTDFFEYPIKLQLLSCCCNLLFDSMSENHPNKNIYETTLNLIHSIDESQNDTLLLYNYMIWEKNLLKELGFALTLNKCNATGTTENLCYISPKSGHAICESAGKPYEKKLLKMPDLWKIGKEFSYDTINKENISEKIKVLEYFFNKHIYSEKHKDIPYIRRNLTRQ